MYQHRYIAASQHLMNRAEKAAAKPRDFTGSLQQEVIEQTYRKTKMTHADTTYTKLYGTKIRETDKAVYFRVIKVAFEDVPNTFESHEQDTFWFPLSQLRSLSTPADPLDMHMIEVADWILVSKGIIGKG